MGKATSAATLHITPNELTAGIPHPKGELVYGSVTRRQAIEHRSLLKYGTASIATHHDAPDERIVTELQVYGHAAFLETRRLTDFDARKNRWSTYGEARRMEITDRREIRRLAKFMLDQVDALPERHSTGLFESFYSALPSH